MYAIRIRSFLGTLALGLLAACAAVSPDYAREKRLADEVSPTLVVGEAVRLTNLAGHRFLGIYTPATSPRAGVLLVHGMGVHPDFGVTGALRAMLADRGYSTLSIQMPVLASEAQPDDYLSLFSEAGERIAAGLAHLRARGLQKVAIVSHSMGARMVNDFLAHHPDARLMAWVPLAISNGQLGPLSGVRFPVFDIYAEKDFDVVMKGARARAAVLRTVKGSKQAMVFGTDHYFARREKEVASLIDRLLTPLAK